VSHLLSSTPLRRRLLLAAALLVAPAIVLTTPGAASAAPTRDRADAAAGWAGRQLDDDTHLVQTAFGADYGLSADIVLALSAAGVGSKQADLATRALRRSVPAYTGGGDPKESYAGSYAKLLVVADAQGFSPTAFGKSGRKNLVKRLRALECGTAKRTTCTEANKGRFSDKSQFGDFSNAITQSLALIGLDRATASGPSTAAVRFLRTQQCDNGAFPLTFGGASCVGSVDATGFAVQALVQVGTRPALRAAQDAGRWLRRRQSENGSFSGNGTNNANSTALAAQGFDALEMTQRADEARAFLRSLQIRCGGKAKNRGAVRYDNTGTGDLARATAQAVPALAAVTLGQVSGDAARAGLPRLAC
jgi:hypothetical protein